MTVLGATCRVVRSSNDGSWRTSRPVWTIAEDWLGTPPTALTEQEGYAELTGSWLWSYGPGTEDDLAWWLGATRSAVRRALSDVAAVPVRLEDGSPAWLLPHDLDVVPDVADWAALLPALDPTTMGWRGRAFFIDDRTVPSIYDSAGNSRPTAWWNGRIVGGWEQDREGRVVVLPTASLPRGAAVALEREARRLTDWLNGDVIRSSLHSTCIDRTQRSSG